MPCGVLHTSHACFIHRGLPSHACDGHGTAMSRCHFVRLPSHAFMLERWHSSPFIGSSSSKPALPRRTPKIRWGSPLSPTFQHLLLRPQFDTWGVPRGSAVDGVVKKDSEQHRRPERKPEADEIAHDRHHTRSDNGNGANLGVSPLSIVVPAYRSPVAYGGGG